MVGFHMFRCTTCGSITQTAEGCGVCGGAVREVLEDPSRRITKPVSRQQLRVFWTGTTIVAMTIIVLFAVSSVGVGLYLSARPAGPSCSNSAVNYPSCNSCISSETYLPATNSCSCTNGAVNGPKCNRWCANNAINPSIQKNNMTYPGGCDLCADHRTDIVCPPGLPPGTSKTENSSRLETSLEQS